MISNQILQATLDGLKQIARVDLAITDPEGRCVVSTGDIAGLSKDAVEFASSGADSQEIKGNQYFKIYDDQTLEYVLAVAGAGEDEWYHLSMVKRGKDVFYEIDNLGLLHYHDDGITLGDTDGTYKVCVDLYDSALNKTPVTAVTNISRDTTNPVIDKVQVMDAKVRKVYGSEEENNQQQWFPACFPGKQCKHSECSEADKQHGQPR